MQSITPFETRRGGGAGRRSLLYCDFEGSISELDARTFHTIQVQADSAMIVARYPTLRCAHPRPPQGHALFVGFQSHEAQPQTKASTRTLQ